MEILFGFLIWDAIGIFVLLWQDDKEIFKSITIRISPGEILFNVLIWTLFLFVLGLPGPLWLFFRKERL